MKNSSLKSKLETPKTPGGISKSLLTPCRRVGLSRKWKKGGVSPFNSPLSSTSVTSPITPDSLETRKRKETDDSSQKSLNADADSKDGENTPTRIVAPRKKKSKSLITSLNTDSDNITLVLPSIDTSEIVTDLNTDRIEANSKDTIEHVSTPVKLKSKSKSKKKSPASSMLKPKPEKENLNLESEVKEVKERSPNNLTKECIVVIQKKIFKKDFKEKEQVEAVIKNETETKKTSQTLFDSDSDDVPLCKVNKVEDNPIITEKVIDNDDDIEVSKTKTKKDSKKPSQEKSRKTETKPSKLERKLSKSTPKPEISVPTQSTVMSDDDDDFFEKKRTIIIKKTYDKNVSKPTKAKSTGSITLKDIEELKAKIETKKKMLLAKQMPEETKDLMELIKKWQRGCQDALTELMELMKNKSAEHKNMGYSEILKALKIPSSLVGYDSDNDCFVTPEDRSVILANLDD